MEEAVYINESGEGVKNRGECSGNVVCVGPDARGGREAKDGISDKGVKGKGKYCSGGRAALTDTAVKINFVLRGAEQTDNADGSRVKEDKIINNTVRNAHIIKNVEDPLMGEGWESGDKVGKENSGVGLPFIRNRIDLASISIMLSCITRPLMKPV